MVYGRNEAGNGSTACAWKYYAKIVQQLYDYFINSIAIGVSGRSES